MYLKDYKDVPQYIYGIIFNLLGRYVVLVYSFNSTLNYMCELWMYIYRE